MLRCVFFLSFFLSIVPIFNPTFGSPEEEVKTEVLIRSSYQSLKETKSNVKKLHQFREQDIHFLLGNTQAGKSSLIAYLAGFNLEVVNRDRYHDLDRQGVALSREQPENLQGIQDLVSIGNRDESCTKEPVLLAPSDSQPGFCDVPGFCDSREDIGLALKATYLTKRVLETAKNVKFIVILTPGLINEVAGNGAKSLLNVIESIFSPAVWGHSLITLTHSSYPSTKDAEGGIREKIRTNAMDLIPKTAIAHMPHARNYSIGSLYNPRENHQEVKEIILEKLRDIPWISCNQIGHNREGTQHLDFSNIYSQQVQDDLKKVIASIIYDYLKKRSVFFKENPRLLIEASVHGRDDFITMLKREFNEKLNQPLEPQDSSQQNFMEKIRSFVRNFHSRRSDEESSIDSLSLCRDIRYVARNLFDRELKTLINQFAIEEIGNDAAFYRSITSVKQRYERFRAISFGGIAFALAAPVAVAASALGAGPLLIASAALCGGYTGVIVLEKTTEITKEIGSFFYQMFPGAWKSKEN